MTKPADNGGKRYWQSLESRAASEEFVEELHNEFPRGATMLEMTGVSRRHFLGLMGASVALAGVGTSGCIRKPEQHILPYAKRPEDLIPGVPRYFASAFAAGPAVQGVLVTSHDGRPTKIDGNPDHPYSLGGTNAWTQAAVLGLYDPDRSTSAARHDEGGFHDISLDEARTTITERLAEARGANGAKTALLIDALPSPTFKALVADFQRSFPEATVYRHDPLDRANEHAALTGAGARGRRVQYELREADVVLTLDADILGLDGDGVRNARHFADARRVTGPRSDVSRLYAVEPAYTVTGMVADNRLQVPATQVGTFLRALAADLFANGLDLPSAAAGLRTVLGGAPSDDTMASWVSAVSADLRDAGESAVIAVGARQPAWVHALALLINDRLGAIGNTIQLFDDPDEPEEIGSLDALAAALADGSVDTLLICSSDPVGTAPADLGIGEKIAGVEFAAHFGLYRDATASSCTLHVPASHFLEAWGDLRATDGTVAIQQPLIAPLYDTISAIEFAGLLVGRTDDGYALVRDHWSRQPEGRRNFDETWNRWLNNGVAAGTTRTPRRVALNWRDGSAAIADAAPPEPPSRDALEVVFSTDYSVADGRFGNNAWLQEMPDPVTKLTWDNAAIISPRTAEALGLSWGTADQRGQERADMITLSVGGASIEIAAFAFPGVAENTVILPVGYGQTIGGRVSTGAGFDATPLRTTAAPHIATGATITKTGERYLLATTQDHWQIPANRPLVREASAAEFRENPNFATDMDIMDPSHIKSLWDEPNPEGGQQWGMAIDLGACIGCNACVVSCQAENNIAVVGKERVLMGREMHWLRVDRYFRGEDVNQPDGVALQPMPCQQCENAPCESVCPVAATVHSPDGLNDMAYNRCIGTRYCANNCPFKVRRFNYFSFSRDNDEEFPMARMQKNPDVTVRFRGVMEKCTYCVQRINAAKIAAKVDGDGVVPDGEIVPACAQACPTQAIVFGDINDRNTQVARQKRQERNYALLSELNIKPRTTYLAKISNPNDDLA